jgi:hypothetical protein
MIGWLNDHLHPEPMNHKCGSVYVAPFPFLTAIANYDFH